MDQNEAGELIAYVKSLYSNFQINDNVREIWAESLQFCSFDAAKRAVKHYVKSPKSNFQSKPTLADITQILTSWGELARDNKSLAQRGYDFDHTRCNQQKKLEALMDYHTPQVITEKIKLMLPSFSSWSELIRNRDFSQRFTDFLNDLYLELCMEKATTDLLEAPELFDFAFKIIKKNALTTRHYEEERKQAYATFRGNEEVLNMIQNLGFAKLRAMALSDCSQEPQLTEFNSLRFEGINIIQTVKNIKSIPLQKPKPSTKHQQDFEL